MPTTPVGRLKTMQVRLEDALRAIATIRPALSTFYNLLKDRQKLQLERIS